MLRDSTPVAALNAEHADYTAMKGVWQQYEDFYAGGRQFAERIDTYLRKRAKEPVEIYNERKRRAFYENYLGAIAEWYVSTLFRTAPQVSTPEDEFYPAFLENANMAGCDFVEFARCMFSAAMIHRRAYALIDFPKQQERPVSRAEEDALGLSHAYLVMYEAPAVLDWQMDAMGQLEWVKVKTRERFKADPLSGQSMIRDTWVLYTREAYSRYVIEYEESKEPADSTPVALADTGGHALADQGVVPMLVMEIPDGIWLTNRVAGLAWEHFEKSNALSWALHNGLLAMPIVYSDREWKQIVGESYFIQLGPQDKFGYTEPAGNTFTIAAENLDRLKEEMYRVCYLMTQAAGKEARGVAVSGVSKQRDYQATEEVLKRYGALVRDFMRNVLLSVARARKDDETAVGILGLDRFDIRDLSLELDDAAKARTVVTKSPTFRQLLERKVAAKYLDDQKPEDKKKVDDELKAADFEQDDKMLADVMADEARSHSVDEEP